jgi:hypothetical protein
MNLNKILTIIFLAASAFLGFRLYRGVEGTIEERENIKNVESSVIEKLKLIREAEIVFNEVNKRYTASWDTLANFIENGKVPIIQRREVITQKAYGVEDVKIFIDTLGFTPAKERIFKKNYTLNASDNGVFKGYKVKEGERVIKNQKAYVISVGGKEQSPPFSEQGIITKLEPLNPGDEVKKGQQLIAYWDYQFNPNIDLKTLGELPGKAGKKFDIFVGKVDRNGVLVQVIEVKDPDPINKARKESNEQKNRKPLHFGSRTDVSTSGNWE